MTQEITRDCVIFTKIAFRILARTVNEHDVIIGMPAILYIFGDLTKATEHAAIFDYISAQPKATLGLSNNAAI